ncbi:MAG: hypothetical protein PF501_01285 [Salinisphaera sp.]|jgi:hypothetical protein|nr:hypothetical protein [Salinisphaera sp.]
MASDIHTTLRAIAGPCESDQANALAPLIDQITALYSDSLQGIIYYGSCLRSGNPYEGLVDFYVVVDSYRRAHAHWLAATANALIPPNVYYLEAEGARGQLRCKYAVINEPGLVCGVRTNFLSALWGRLAQPVAIVHAANDDARQRLQTCCGQAVVTLLNRSLPALRPPASAAETYARALALSYSGELRTEHSSRSGEVVAQNAGEYARRVHAAIPVLSFSVHVGSDGQVAWQPSAAQKHRAQRAWRLMRPAGRALSIARLSKACFTFGDAVDYGAWKIERHTGIHVEVTPRLRKHPLIFGWPVLWRLYRAGTLR